MGTTPLFRSLKPSGTTIFCMPGASEDISSAYQNTNYKMYFSKYILLNLPKQETTSDPKYFDFENAFSKSSTATPAPNFNDAIVESLRNYVANQEVVIRESRLNNTNYYYNTNALETVSEKIFWKWCKKLNIIDFEPAIPGDEYFDNLSDFASRDINDDEYFQEYLWKEREIIDWNTNIYYETADITYLGKLEIELNGTTNFRVGDLINIYNVTNALIIAALPGSETENGVQVTILKSTPASGTTGQIIIVDVATTLSEQIETTGQARLVYSRLINYIGEVNGVSNVQEANRSYTSVYAHIPDHTGQTPDILFRTKIDVNYKPNLTFPIVPNQYQPEIMGAEFFNSPIVSQPQNYPGSYYGQFDTLDFTYKTSTGDDLRRSGDYFGVSGDINNIIVDSSNIDGLNIDFNTSHYVKMNIPYRSVSNFDQFNALEVNNEPPKDFEFNSILWYYTVEDNNGNIATNLYGISFLDNPNNNLVEEEIGFRFPTVKKLVTNGQQDGTSYGFNLGLNFNIINENPTETYNPEAINSLFSMNLFNQVMSKLSSTNDSFLNTIAEQSNINEEILYLKSILYSQTDLNVLNAKIKNLEDLLRMYSTNQLVTSSSVEVNTLPGTPPSISLNDISTEYARVDNIKTTQLYSNEGIIPINVNIPKNRNLLISILNDDKINVELENNDKLAIVLDKDLYLNQILDINIIGEPESSENKKLDIFMISNAGSIDNINSSEILVLGNIDLPVFYNTDTQLANSAYLWKGFDFKIDFNQDIYLESEDILKIPFEGNTYLINSSIKEGDVLYLNNLFISDGLTSVYDFSGQYIVDGLNGATSSYITFDISSNKSFVSTYSGESFPYTIHRPTSTLLTNKPYFSLNKGKNIKITRISNSSILNERYSIIINDMS